MGKLREVEVNDFENYVPVYRGYFHQWSVIADSYGTYPVAIIEDKDGQVHSVAVWKIKFIKD